MTFSFFEKSLQQASPQEIYLIQRGVNLWRFTSGQSQVTHLGSTYTPLPIDRSNIIQTKELNRSNLQLTVPRNASFIQDFIRFPPTEVMTLTVFRRHSEDTLDNEFAEIWNGRVLNIEWTHSKAKVTCESLFTSIRRPGIHMHYQATCPHVLYGNACRANQQSFKATGNILSVSGLNVTIAIASAKADGYYSGGFLTTTFATGVTEKRMIINHVSTTITLVAPIDKLLPGQSVDIFAGCGHDLDDCENKFSNLDNYGGYPFSPPFTPFGGQTLF